MDPRIAQGILHGLPMDFQWIVWWVPYGITMDFLIHSLWFPYMPSMDSLMDYNWLFNGLLT